MTSAHYIDREKTESKMNRSKRKTENNGNCLPTEPILESFDNFLSIPNKYLEEIFKLTSSGVLILNDCFEFVNLCQTFNYL